MPTRNPPPQIPVIIWDSPNKADTGLIEFWNTELKSYVPLDIGAAHPNSRDYPGYKLGIQAGLQGDEKWVRRVWVTDNTNQDWYNYQLKYSAQANAYPIFIREYQEPKSTYAPRAKGSALQVVYKLQLAVAGSGYDPSLKSVSLTFSGGGGSGAAGRALISPDGKIASLILDDGGSGYTSAPTFTVASPTSGVTATGTALIQTTGAVLVQEEAGLYPKDNENYALYFNVLRVYETLPGPWVPFTRYDENLGPVQGGRRAVLAAAGQVPSLTATAKTTYEGRDGSAIVSWQIEEAWSDGTSSPDAATNPPYPITVDDFFEESRGAVQRTSQIVVATGSEVGSLLVATGTATLTRYEAFNQFLLKKVIEIWAIPGPLRLQAPKYDAELGQSTSTIQLVENTGQTGTRIATKDTQYRASSYGAAVREELIDDWSDTMPTRPGYTWDDVRGNVTQSLRNVVLAGGEAASLAVAAGTATQISYKPVDQFSATKLTESWALPGPLLRNAERYDEALGNITGTRQLVENTSQTQSAGAASQTRYEASPFGGVILWEIVESWDTSAFPVRIEDTYENERGAVQSASQLVVATGGEAGSLAVADGVATHVEYKPRDAFLLTKVTETWAVPAVPLPSESVNEDGTTTVTTKTMSLASAITEGETLSAGTWTKTSSQAITATISWKIAEARPIPGNAIPSVEPDDDGDVLSRSKTLSAASAITASDSVSAGVWTNVKSEPVSDLVAWKVVTARSIPGTPLAGASASMPRVTPAKFILSESTAVTRTKVAAGTLPDDPTNEGDSSKVTPINAAVSMKETESVTLETTDPVEYGMVQGQLETITVTHGSGSAPEIGFLTTDVSVVHEGGGVFVTKAGAVSEWLPLYGQSVDNTTRIKPMLTKQFVPNDPTQSVPNGIKGGATLVPGSSLTVIETQPYDFQKSLAITTTITNADLPAPYSWTTTRELSLPEELLDITTYYDTSSTTSDGVGHDLYSQNEDRWGGEVSTILRKLLGPFDCTITRSYHIGAPTIVATPTRFTLKSGTVVIKGGAKGSSWSSNSDGDVRVTESNSVSYRAIELPFSMCYDLSDSPSFGSNTASFTIVQPQSTPPIMPDTVIQVEVRELGIGGIFAMDVLSYAITT